jgi:hypothetical protein
MKKIVHPCVLLLCLFTMLATPFQAVADDKNYPKIRITISCGF